MADAKAEDEACSVSDLSREELEEAYFEIVRYAQQLQGREAQMTSAFRVLRQKYTALKEEMSELLWTKLRRPDCILDQMPPLSARRRLARASLRGSADAALAVGPSRSNDIVENEQRVGRYELGATLGMGSSAVVRECHDTGTGETLALKIVDKAKVTRRAAAPAVARAPGRPVGDVPRPPGTRPRGGFTTRSV